MSVPEDLSRFLFMVPFVAARPEGVPVAELCEQLSMTPKALGKLLEKVAMVGAPDGGPDEMVEIYLEGGRVFVALSQRFTRPPRFSVEEMLALLVALAPLREGAPPTALAVASDLSDRLVQLASERATELAPSLRDHVRVSVDAAESPKVLRCLEQAATERRVVDAEYYTAGRDAFGARRLKVIGLLQVRGAWYAATDDGKIFKVERFRDAALTDETFEATTLDLTAARERLERLDFGGAPVEVEIDGERRRFDSFAAHALRRWVRGWRGRARIVAPEEARQAIIEETRTLLARYE